MRKIPTTRFILSIAGSLLLSALAFYAIAKGDTVTAPLCVPFIGGVIGVYNHGKSKNNDTYMNTNKKTEG